MKVFKFGGASVKSATGVRNVASIIAQYPPQGLLIVVSAMGKTTNSLENVLSAVRAGRNASHLLDELYEYHLSVMKPLFPSAHSVYAAVDQIISELRAALTQSYDDYDMVYDQVVAKGELISSTIVHHHLADHGLPSTWLDARACIATDNTFREGKVDWNKTMAEIAKVKPLLTHGIVITQGFIGQTEDGLTTTLGREGSDFTAAIFASCLDAESVTIWKDVPGVMSADPKRLPDATVFSELPYREAAEMTYYGASVIHPKTIKPLANKGIPLWVKNFDDPALPGTIIHDCTVANLPPLIVFKENQCLVSCKVTDFTFITE
ncbi:MAG TPA: aspartate kinase, partial [Ohtaekwangia sp.]|nr:aspartate kinase [Ohtaekwangia sp.]